MNVTLSCMLVSTIFLLGLVSFTPVSFAESYASITDSEITISVTPEELSAGKDTQISIIIKNTNQTRSILLDKVTMISPFDSKEVDISLEPKEAIDDEEYFIVKPSNSKAIITDLTIPSGSEPKKYALIFAFEDSKGHVKTVSKELTVQSFKPLEFSWMLALLTAFLIPATIIERILERTKIIKPKEEDSGDPKIPKKIIDTKMDILHKNIDNLKGRLEFWMAIKKHIIEAKKTEIKTSKLDDLPDIESFYSKDLKNLDKKIEQVSLELSKKKHLKALRVWEYGLVLSIFPAILFSIYGLGILQIMNYVGPEFKVFDGIINALFIASGTKPIHDIINILTSTKK